MNPSSAAVHVVARRVTTIIHKGWYHMTKRLIGALLFLGVLASCGGDDSGGNDTACVVGNPCACTDPTTGAMTQGAQLCQPDLSFGLCNCAPAVPGTGGTTPPIMTGSTGGTTPPPGTGGMGIPAGSGGSGGMMSMDDGGVEPDIDGGAGSGAQGSACAASTDCDNGLACYNNNFCSKSCTSNADCSGIAGGKTYTCYMMGMVCRIDCMANGDADCPTGFTCQDVTGGVRRCELP